jgi:hypothetical protein
MRQDPKVQRFQAFGPLAGRLPSGWTRTPGASETPWSIGGSGQHAAVVPANELPPDRRLGPNRCMAPGARSDDSLGRPRPTA